MKRFITGIAILLLILSVPALAFEFSQVDRNGDGKIDVSEYTAALEFVAKEKFNQLDKNRDGFLDKAEFAELTDITFDKLEEGGKIDSDEFFALLLVTSSEEFKLLDKQGKGFLDKAAFEAAQYAVQPRLRTCFGKVVNLNKETKSLVVKVELEGDIYLEKTFSGTKEYLGDGKDRKFDISRAFFSGSRDIKEGDSVRVGYNLKDNVYRANSVLKIEAKQQK